MNARLRRFSSSGLLLLAALSIGCGSDSNTALLPAVSSLPPQGGVVAPGSGATDFAPLTLTRTAQVVGAGTVADAEAANRAADAIYSVVGGGALEAASPTGGAIQESSSALQLASVATAPEPGTVASDAQTPRLGSVISTRSPLTVSTLGSTTFTFDGETMTVRGTDGLELTFTGVGPLRETEAEDSRLTGLTISADVHVIGKLAATEARRDVDLRVRGFTGRVLFPGENIDPVFDVEVGDPGVSAEGRIFMLQGAVAVSGLSGRFTNAAELNARLSGATLRVRVTDLRADDLFSALRVDATVTGLQVPVNGSRPTVRALSGTADFVPDNDFPLSRDGKIAHVGIDVSAASPIVLNGEYDGPSSGTATVTIHYAASGVRDTLTVVFVNGEPMISGTRTNVSGLPETISTTGDTTTASGTARFADGQLTEHEVEVKRRGGRRSIVFRVRVKSAAGEQLLYLIATVKPDKSLSGTWTRDGAARAAAQPTIQVADGSGTFRVTVEGILELIDAGGGTVARAQMPSGWNRGL